MMMIEAISSIQLPSSPFFRGEKLFYKGLKTTAPTRSLVSESAILINIIDHVSGNIDRRCLHITTSSSSSSSSDDAQYKILSYDRLVIFCDCESGFFSSYDLSSSTNISRLSVKLKKGSIINSIKCSQLDNIMFYTVIGESRIRAVAVQEGRLNSLQDLKLNISVNDISEFKPNMIPHPNRSCLFVLTELGSIQLYDYSSWAKVMKKKFFDVASDPSMDEQSEETESRSSSSITNESILMATFDLPDMGSGKNPICKCTHWAINHDFTILHAVYNRDIMCTYSLAPLFASTASSTSMSSKVKLAPTATYQNKSKVSSSVVSTALSPRGDYFYQLLQVGNGKAVSTDQGVSRNTSIYSITIRSLSDQSLPPLHCEELVMDSSFPTVSHFFLCPISDRFVLTTKMTDSSKNFSVKVLFLEFSNWWRRKVCPSLVAEHLTLPMQSYSNTKDESPLTLLTGDKDMDQSSLSAIVPFVEVSDQPHSSGKKAFLFC